ncbi:ThuA domain-containing protein [Paenibacillus hunanensis]|uniref:ThuA domain-containing protein n=1 Tax=Paenibacillus hunanensis TaxID=539262 RepID=UPI0020276AFF|nr:ThuA domain-containing protein [Paenibacillus hunanensis]MCL9661760.1 ThuA domain-containing protein [Paenibacillus hunanensis]
MSTTSNSKPHIKQALLIGDYGDDAPYHPLDQIQGHIDKLMPEGWELHVSDDYDMFEMERLEAYDLCIVYTDAFNKRISSRHAAGILTYVANGGGLLILHCGVSLQETRYELKQLMGAQYRGHTDYRALEMHVSSHVHPIMQGISSFVMEEEPYEFTLLPGAERTILMEYMMDGEMWPAAWCSEYALGRTVYVMPGHHAPSFEQPELLRLIAQSMIWAAGE